MINRSSLKGSVCIFNSSAFALTRLVTGQLDAYIDITGWLVDDGNKNTHLPQFSTHNMVMGLVANDIAAAYLIARECHCAISDSWGDPRDDQSLISKDILSCKTASIFELHQMLVNRLNKSD